MESRRKTFMTIMAVPAASITYHRVKKSPTGGAVIAS